MKTASEIRGVLNYVRRTARQEVLEAIQGRVGGTLVRLIPPVTVWVSNPVPFAEQDLMHHEQFFVEDVGVVDGRVHAHGYYPGPEGEDDDVSGVVTDPDLDTDHLIAILEGIERATKGRG